MWFFDIIDIAVMDFMMSHSDTKHTYMKDLRTGEIQSNLMFDYGRA